MTKKVLVTLSTGRLGQGICDAFLMAEEEYQVYGTSQDRDDPSLRNKGIIPFEFGNYASVINALKESQASVVVVITGDGYGTKKLSQNNEFENAKLIIDACAESQDQIDHLFVASLFACDEGPRCYGCRQGKATH
jgi:NAD(P)-dependent dehydrogenase (short-subunit alcohol dehydrogenase family)